MVECVECDGHDLASEGWPDDETNAVQCNSCGTRFEVSHSAEQPEVVQPETSGEGE